MPSLQTMFDGTIDSGDNGNVILDFDTFILIRDMCTEFHLTADIEFTCYEAYTIYMQRYFYDLQRRIQQSTPIAYNINNCMKTNNNNYYSVPSTTSNIDGSPMDCANILATNFLIDKLLGEVEQSTLLHVLALISLCAKYINGYRSENLIKKISTYLQYNGTACTVHEIRNSEYMIFKCLAFNVSVIE